jgi:hypothetical protein
VISAGIVQFLVKASHLFRSLKFVPFSNTFVLLPDRIYLIAKSKALMVTLEKMARLAQGCCFDSLGQNTASIPNAGPTNLHSEKLHTLGAGTKYDVCTSSGCAQVRGICHSFAHDGRCISLFKTLYTNHCTHQCNYCTNSSNCSNRAKIFSYTPEELARLTFSLYRSNYVEGLFLSSGS